MLDSWQMGQVGYYAGYGEYIHENCGDGALVTLRAERLMAVGDRYVNWYTCVGEAIEQLSERLRLDESFSTESRYGLGEHKSQLLYEEAQELDRLDLGWSDLLEHLGVDLEQLVDALDWDDDRTVKDVRDALVEDNLEVQVTCAVCDKEIS